jgi:hypothetical protein
MIKTLITTFGEKLPEYLRDYNQFSPPSPVTQSMIKADTELIAICKKDHSHPTGFERKGWSFWFAPATRQG